MKTRCLIGCVSILAVASMMSACGSDNDVVGNEDKGKVDAAYVWTTDAGIKACTNILFQDGKENVKGTDIGNGAQEFVFTGKQTLKKGTYNLKGWVYIAAGAELTIEPGTIIKGDKETKASLIVERGGKLIAQGTATAPIVFTSEQSAGNRRPGDWGGIIICGKAYNNQKEMQIEGGPRSEEHTSELQSRQYLVCRLLLEKKKKTINLTILLERILHPLPERLRVQSFSWLLHFRSAPLSRRRILSC